MADLWRCQAGEIAQAELDDEDEDAKLEAEKRVLANAEKLYAAAMGAHDLLYESEGSAEASLGAALKHMEELARYEPKFAEAAQQLAGAKAMVEDVSAEARGVAGRVHASPERLGDIEDRLAALDKLKRKYGAGAGTTLGEVIRFGEDAARKLAEVENRDALVAELKAQEAKDATAYRGAAEGLTAARRAAATRLEKQATAEVNDLAMQVKFKVEVTPEPETSGWTGQWTAHGWDRIECLIATNPGEPLKPMQEIASGGEMSRVMLALKVTVEESFAAGAGGGRKAL